MAFFAERQGKTEKMNSPIKTETSIEVIQPQQHLTKESLLGKIQPRQKIEFFEKDEMLSLIAGVPPGKERMLFQFLWMTGCRVTEAITVRRSDIDFMHNEISIRWQKSRKWKFRTIPMHKQLREILEWYVHSLRYDQEVFPFTRQRAWQMCQKYGFGHPHKLRHSFAVNFIRNYEGAEGLRILQLLLGHSKINTTMEYLVFIPEMQKEALDTISYMG